MTGEQAGNVLALLVAAFPDAALDDESSSFWVSEFARLADYEAALETARLIARETRKFPSLAEFRQTYRSRAEARRPRELEPAPPGPLPPEVQRFMQTAFVKDMDLATPPKLVRVEDGTCADCKTERQRVAYGKLELCGPCALARARAAVQFEGWRYREAVEESA